MGKMFASGSKRHIEAGGLDFESRLHGLLVGGSNSAGLFPVGTLEEATLCNSFQVYRRCMARTLAGMTRVDSSTLRRVRGNVLWTLLSAFKWGEFASNIYCNYKAPMICQFHSLRHLTVTCTLKTKRHRTYVVQYSQLAFFFNISSQYEGLCANFPSSCIICCVCMYTVCG
jgi:hypothetical protein